MAKESQGIISYIATTTGASTNTVLGEIVGFNGPNQSAAPIDVTHLQSTAKEKLIGVYDGGQVGFSLNMAVTDAGQKKAREMMAARTKGAILIQLSTTATTQKITAKGFVSGLTITGGVDNKVAGDLSFAISGGVSWST